VTKPHTDPAMRRVFYAFWLVFPNRQQPINKSETLNRQQTAAINTPIKVRHYP
jgi:hypothetical protein